MTQVVEVPGMGDVEFPDDMTDDQITAVIRQNMPKPIEPQHPMGTFPIGLDARSAYAANFAQRGNDIFKGFENRLGVTADPLKDKPVVGPLETIAAGGSGLAGTVAGGLAGIGQGIYNLFDDEGTPAADRVRKVQEAMTYRPRTYSGQVLTGLTSLPGEAWSKGTDYLGNKVLEKTDSPTLATIVKTLGEAVPMAIPAISPIKNRNPNKPNEGFTDTKFDVPTVEQLKSRASDAYKRSEEIGAVVGEGRFKTFQTELETAMNKGGIDKDLHPDASAAMKRIMAEGGPMTLEKLETLRRIAMDAEGSLKPPDARMAGQMVDAIDDMVDRLSPNDLVAGTPEAAASLKQARNLWSRARKAEVLDELQRRAELSAPNFSGSGLENALRTEFRALAKNQRKMRQFSKEERAAIERVAKGGPVENTLRFLGKAAPTGVVSTSLGTGLGFLAGGPAGAAAVPTFGAISRLGARGLTNRNVRLANELVRMGRSVDDLFGYAGTLGRSPQSGNRSPVGGANAAAGTGNPLGQTQGFPPGAGIPASQPGSVPGTAPGSGVLPQVSGASGKTLEQLYLEALVEELRQGRR